MQGRGTTSSKKPGFSLLSLVVIAKMDFEFHGFSHFPCGSYNHSLASFRGSISKRKYVQEKRVFVHKNEQKECKEEVLHP